MSFQLSDAFENEEVRDAMQSGLTITFVYDVELRRSASLAGSIARLLSSTVSAGVRYDKLTRRYHVTLNADGRIEDAERSSARAGARLAHALRPARPRSAAPLEPNAEYYVRVRARTTPRNASFVWPWRHATSSGLAKFTFLR